MRTAVVCFCTEDYEQQARKARDSIIKYAPNKATMIIDMNLPIIDYGVPTHNNLGKLNWCLQRFAVFDRYKEYDRVIMIDSDIEAIGNIDLLFSEELNDYDLCCVEDYGAKHYYPNTTKQYEHVINAGVFIINKSFREKFDFLKELPNLESYNGTEQGYYTDFVHKYPVKIHLLPVKYNYCIDGYYPKEEDIRIKHYSGGY